MAWKGVRKGARYTALLALVEYIGLIYCTTVILRRAMKVSKYDWHPFWSYQAIEAGTDRLIGQNIMNIVMFIPIGLLLCLAFKNLRWYGAMVVALVLSVSIEWLQYVYAKGFSEVDDVMHNTLGCLIGYGMIILMRLVYKRVSWG